MMKRLILLLTMALPALAENTAWKLFPLENNLLCVRPGDISERFAAQFRDAVPTNRLSGLVLDLRRAGGTNQTGVADFLTAKKIPLVVLTDAQTLGAAAALAEQLHTTGAVVIACGTNTAAKAPADLRVALTPEDEKKFLENPFTNSPSTAAGKLSATNSLLFYVDHTSEAELVRKRVKDGEDEDTETPRATPTQPVIRDPALARAVDLLKALAVLHRTRG